MSLILHQSLEKVKEPSSMAVGDRSCDLIPMSRRYSFTKRILGLVLLNLEGPDEKVYRSHSLGGLAHLSNASNTARLYKFHNIFLFKKYIVRVQIVIIVTYLFGSRTKSENNNPHVFSCKKKELSSGFISYSMVLYKNKDVLYHRSEEVFLKGSCQIV